MKFVITGGSGFIGTSLCKYLLNKNHDVISIDIKDSNIKHEKFHNYIINLVDNSIPENIIKNCDILIHLASIVGVKNVINDNDNIIKNISMLNNILPTLKKYNKKIVFSSSSEVYGSGNNLKESNKLIINNTQDVRWSYCCSKITQEFYITLSGLDYIIMRFFNIVRIYSKWRIRFWRI